MPAGAKPFSPVYSVSYFYLISVCVPAPNSGVRFNTTSRLAGLSSLPPLRSILPYSIILSTVKSTANAELDDVSSILVSYVSLITSYIRRREPYIERLTFGHTTREGPKE